MPISESHSGAPAYVVWHSGRKALERMNANRGCAGNTVSYEDNFRIPIWVQGRARGRALLPFGGAEGDEKSPHDGRAARQTSGSRWVAKGCERPEWQAKVSEGRHAESFFNHGGESAPALCSRAFRAADDVHLAASRCVLLWGQGGSISQSEARRNSHLHLERMERAHALDGCMQDSVRSQVLQPICPVFP